MVDASLAQPSKQEIATDPPIDPCEPSSSVDPKLLNSAEAATRVSQGQLLYLRHHRVIESGWTRAGRAAAHECQDGAARPAAV
jgi:hypothetical protein